MYFRAKICSLELICKQRYGKLRCTLFHKVAATITEIAFIRSYASYLKFKSFTSSSSSLSEKASRFRFYLGSNFDVVSKLKVLFCSFPIEKVIMPFCAHLITVIAFIQCTLKLKLALIQDAFATSVRNNTFDWDAQMLFLFTLLTGAESKTSKSSYFSLDNMPSPFHKR